MEKNGTLIQLEPANAQRLSERLNDEKTVRALDHLLERIDTLEQAVDRLATVMEQGPGLLSMATDAADEAIRDAERQGINVEERLGLALGLAEKLTRPALVEKLHQTLQLADQLPGLIAMGIDSLDQEFERAAMNGINFQALGQIGQKVGQALSEAQQQPITGTGLFGLMRALNDPDRQKALGFLMNFTKQLGTKLP